MIAVRDTTITMTRGDTLRVLVTLTQDGETYTPTEGDAVRFAMRPAGLNSKGTAYKYDICLMKDIPIDTMVLELEPDDTKPFPFGEYTYDIQITFEDGTVDTPIYEAKLILAPEVE